MSVVGSGSMSVVGSGSMMGTVQARPVVSRCTAQAAKSASGEEAPYTFAIAPPSLYVELVVEMQVDDVYERVLGALLATEQISRGLKYQDTAVGLSSQKIT